MGIKALAKLEPKNANMEYVWSKARQGQKTIVLPEAEDERTLKAAEMVEEVGLGKVILIGKEDEVRKRAKSVGANINNIQVLDHEKCTGSTSMPKSSWKSGRARSLPSMMPGSF